MKKLSTPCMNEMINNQKKDRNNERSNPRKKTLDFLTQFARAYQAEPAIQQDLCGYVMN